MNRTKKADDPQIKAVRKAQRKTMFAIWIRRFFLIFIVVCVCADMQYFARMSVPERFSVEDTVEKMVFVAAIIFCGVNFLSWIELLYENKILFNIKKMPVIKVSVKKKLVSEQFSSFLYIKSWNIYCEDESGKDYSIEVGGIFAYSSIREGDNVYIAKNPDNADDRYYYIARERC